MSIWQKKNGKRIFTGPHPFPFCGSNPQRGLCPSNEGGRVRDMTDVKRCSAGRILPNKRKEEITEKEEITFCQSCPRYGTGCHMHEYLS